MSFREKIAWSCLLSIVVVFVLAEAVKFATQVVGYRRDAWMGHGQVVNNIRRLRFDAGEMTQHDLADRVGVTRQTIIAIEAAKYAPSLELAFRIADAFGRALEEVFRYEKPAPRRAVK